MVEAAGIEPASESTTLRHLHVYPDYYVSDFKMPSGRLFEIQSPFVLLKSQEKFSWASLLNDTDSWNTDNFRAAAAYLIKQRVPVRYWRLCLFSAFLRGYGATTCNLILVTPVEPFRPLFLLIRKQVTEIY